MRGGVEGRFLARTHAASRQASFPPPPGRTAPLAVRPFFARGRGRTLHRTMADDGQRGGTSGRRLAIAIVLIGAAAAVAALYFREFTPRIPPTTQPVESAVR